MWPRESLAGINLSVDGAEASEEGEQSLGLESGVYLAGISLPNADLGFANLEGADLGFANLEGAVLGNANLEGANLGNANLEGAVLEYANLEGAVLPRTRLSNAEGLTPEQLSKAQLCETELPDYIDLDPNYHCGALKERYPGLFLE
ncbi:MAG: pentapeptide repeat-containing protein [Cyanobacteria bacterium P01_A01_bin.123]